MSRDTRATIRLAALRHNLQRVRELAPRSRLMAVVKADGYGHGLERVARELAAADAFGVASIADARRIRAIGLRNRVVVLPGIDAPDDIAQMRRLDLDSVIHHRSQLDWLEADRMPAGERPLRVWLKIDTGMHRLGFAQDQVQAAHERLRRLPAVDPEIVLMTHFANSDVYDDPISGEQTARFAPLAAEMGGERSLANSAAVLGLPAVHADWVRVGGLLYGISVIAGRSAAEFGFHPAMSLSTRLIAINRIARGERIGYGGTWQCPEEMAVGVATVGYGDGYPRSAPSGTPVLIGGVRAPIIGRISMDLITIDLRGHPDAAVGDAVILWGPGLPVEEVAAAAGTIGYELVCGMTRRVDFVDDHAPLA